MIDSILAQNSNPAAFMAPLALPIQQPTIHFFAEPKDPKLGWLAWDFPAPFVGCGNGNKYFSRYQYCAEKMAFFSGQEELRAKILAVKCVSVGPDGQFDQSAVDKATLEISTLLSAASGLLNWTVISEKLQYALNLSAAYCFCQNKQLFDLLLATGNDFLVEATSNRLTGIGYTETAVRANQAPLEQWGKNLHGAGLMKLRDELRICGWEARPKWTYTPPATNQGAPSFHRPETFATTPVIFFQQAPVFTVAEPPAVQNPIVFDQPAPTVSEIIMDEPKQSEVSLLTETVPIVAPVETVVPVTETVTEPTIESVPAPIVSNTEVTESVTVSVGNEL